MVAQFDQHFSATFSHLLATFGSALGTTAPLVPQGSRDGGDTYLRDIPKWRPKKSDQGFDWIDLDRSGSVFPINPEM